MAKGKVSKTNVAARAANKGKNICRDCGNPVHMARTLVGGRKKMIRLCCGAG